MLRFLCFYFALSASVYADIGGSYTILEQLELPLRQHTSKYFGGGNVSLSNSNDVKAKLARRFCSWSGVDSSLEELFRKEIDDIYGHDLISKTLTQQSGFWYASTSSLNEEVVRFYANSMSKEKLRELGDYYEAHQFDWSMFFLKYRWNLSTRHTHYYASSEY